MKNRQFSSPFPPLKLYFGKILWKLMENFILSLKTKKICNYFLPIHHRSTTINFWKRHTWKSRQKLSMDFVTLKNGDTPPFLYVPSLTSVWCFKYGSLESLEPFLEVMFINMLSECLPWKIQQKQWILFTRITMNNKWLFVATAHWSSL